MPVEKVIFPSSDTSLTDVQNEMDILRQTDKLLIPAPPSLVLGVLLTTPEKILMRRRNTVTRRAVLRRRMMMRRRRRRKTIYLAG